MNFPLKFEKESSILATAVTHSDFFILFYFITHTRANRVTPTSAYFPGFPLLGIANDERKQRGG